MNQRFVLLAAACLAVCAVASGPAAAQVEGAPDGAAAAYVQKCAGCHTIGKGKLTGPDLVDSSAWPEPDLSKAIRSMEPRVGPLRDDEVAALVGLLKSPAARDRIDAEAARAAKAAAASYDPPDAAAGRLLFAGTSALANGGPACAACHSVDGTASGLGPDLSGVFAKLGEAPLVSACEKANFKIMDAAYRDHAVTRQEALHLTKYLETVGAAPPRPVAPPVGAIGAGLGVVALALVAFGYRRRHAGVRKSLLRSRHRDMD